MLLHPGSSDKRALDPLIAELDGTYACFSPDQRAHGRSRDVLGPLTLQPDLVRSLVFAAAVFHHEGWLPGVLDGEVPSSMGDSYGELSPDGRNHWPVVVEKLDALHAVAPAATMDDLAETGVVRAADPRLSPRRKNQRARTNPTGLNQPASRNLCGTDIGPTPSCRSVAAVGLAGSGRTPRCRSSFGGRFGACPCDVRDANSARGV